MSTSDQRGPLTRKQLREIRLTGSTPVITDEEAAAAAAEAAPPAPPLPRAAEPASVPPAPVADEAVDLAAAPLTRRQAREQEKIKTASVPVVGVEEETAGASVETPVEVDAAESAPVPAAARDEAEPPAEIVSAVPDFTRSAEPAVEEENGVEVEEIVVEPVRAAEVVETVGEVPLVAEEPAVHAPAEDDVAAVLGIPAEVALEDDDDVLVDGDDEEDVTPGARPTVSPAFGEGVLAEEPEPHAPFRPSFDELLTSGDSAGSQHSAPNALIFTPSPGEGSLSGPVASTGEILVTGSYELPKGIGSQGHAHGTADGKEVDAVLIDGELPPASSPTPIAASSAISTIKPAGEVIRPPAPEKGNRLMLTLAIVAGGLALALGVALIIAFTTNVF